MAVKLGVTEADMVGIGLEVSVNICFSVDEGVKVASGVCVATDVFVFVGNGEGVSFGRGVQVDVTIGVRVAGKI